MQEFLNREYFGNTVYLYLTALGIFILAVIGVLILKRIVLGRLKKWAQSTQTPIDDFIIRGIERTIIPLLFFGAFYIAVTSLVLHKKVSHIIDVASVILLTYFSIRIILSVIRFSLHSYLAGKGQTENKERQITGILTIVNLIIWGLGVVFLLDNLGFQVSAVIAGLGIGGIAIALAAQTILGDLFSYFVIFFDRPFEIGDFIASGDKSGSVEYIGIKTTRVRSLSGEQVIFSNTDLVNSRVHNYKRMERRRVQFTFGVVYETRADQLAEIPGIIKNIIENIPDTAFDRAHFVKYGDFSLSFEVVYYVNNPDYNLFMDIHQKVNLALYREFENRKILFAYPTQTLYVRKKEGQDPSTKPE